MRGLATFIMKGRGQAVSTIAALTVLSWIVSLASLLSAAAIALPTLRKGAVEGGLIMGFAAMVVALIGATMMDDPVRAAAYSLALWTPVWLLAVLLRESSSLDWTLAGAALLAMAMVLVLYAIYGDPTQLWMEELRRLSRPFLESGKSEAELALFKQNLEGLARYMTGGIAAGSMLTLSLSLLIARWWQATLFNPGGFRVEFQGLHVSPLAAYASLGLFALAWIADGVVAELAWNLAIPLSMLFLLAGFAVLHAVFAANPNGGFWLAGVYVALIFASPLIVLIMLLGLSDIWMDWRNRPRTT